MESYNNVAGFERVELGTSLIPMLHRAAVPGFFKKKKMQKMKKMTKKKTNKKTKKKTNKKICEL